MSLKITVTTTSATDEEVCAPRTIDYHDSLHRAWLGKHSYWALNAGHRVTTAPVKGYQK